MHGRRIDAGVHHGRHALVLFEKAFRPRARFVVEIPVKAFSQIHALRCFEAEAVDVGDEHQKAGQRLLGRDAELGRLLDRVGGVGACIGKPDHLRTRSLRLQQERREIGAGKGMPHRTKHFAAVRQHHGSGIFFERLSERVIGGQEEPAVAALLDHRLAGAVGQRVGVVGVMHIGVGAVLAGNQRRRSAGHHGDAVLLLRHRHHGQRR